MTSLLPATELRPPERTSVEQVYGHELQSLGALPTRTKN